MRKGMLVGSGKRGYHNLIPKDPSVHSQSARGMKQPQRINLVPLPKLKSNIFDTFIREVDFKNLRKEISYDEVDGQIRKQQGSATKAVFGTVVDEFKAKTINTIHNHPAENPPSPKDIFAFLYSGRHQEDRVVLPSGITYILVRKPETSTLSMVRRQISEVEGKTPAVITRLNSDKRSAQMQFSKTYNRLVDIQVSDLKSLGLDFNTIRNKYSPKIQEDVLNKIAKIYGFEVRKIQGDSTK